MSRLPQTNVVEMLKNNRNAENSIRLVFNGRLNVNELTAKEQEIYDRVIHLKALIKERQIETGGRYKSIDVIEDHMAVQGVSLATAKRDLAIVNELEKALREASIELERSQLYEAAWRAIEIAEKNAEPAAMASNIRVAKDLLGNDDERGGIGSVSADKIEQHINIIIADKRTERILTEMVEQNVSVQKWSMNLEDILAEEAKPQETEEADYEEIGNGENTTEDSD